MYKEYFGLEENPFSIAPDPRYLYMSEQHREALAHLLYGISGDGGFVLLTGEVGAGKTTVCRCLLEQVPRDCETAFILNPKLTAEELLSVICDEFRISYPKGATSVKVFIDLINSYLLEAHAQGKKSVLIIDEAQNLSADVLEQMRLLTNLETNQRKLLQIIMIGQPELREKLARPELRQFSQRIVARYHLGPLSKQDTASYVVHRLSTAGLRRRVFPPSTLTVLHRLSRGVPRVINLLCDRALLGTYVQGKDRVDGATIKKAARELFGENGFPRPGLKPAFVWPIVGLALLIAAGSVGAALYYRTRIPAHVEDGARPVVVPPSGRSDVSKPESQAPETGQSVQAVPSPTTDASDEAPAPGALQASSTLLKLTERPVPETEEIAYRALLKEWGQEYPAQRDVQVCRAIEPQGMRCLSGHGGLDDLRKLNRPVALKLFGPQGREFHAALTGLDDGTARFAVNDESIVVPIAELASLWRGHYTLLWRPPPRFQGSLQAGDRGPVVEWLRDRLPGSRADAVQAGDSAFFDGALVEEVRKFQLANGLKPDGVVGPHTLIRLDTGTGGTTPSLSGKKENE